MIRISDKSSQVLCKFPKNKSNLGTNHILKLYSESTNKEYEFEVTDSGNYTDYYEFLCDFNEVPKGEYRYTIISNHIVYASGLILIGIDYIKNRTENTKKYENNDNGYIVYNG